MDAPYQATDRINPHFGHWIQPLDEGAWRCITCDGDDDDFPRAGGSERSS